MGAHVDPPASPSASPSVASPERRSSLAESAAAAAAAEAAAAAAVRSVEERLQAALARVRLHAQRLDAKTDGLACLVGTRHLSSCPESKSHTHARRLTRHGLGSAAAQTAAAAAADVKLAKGLEAVTKLAATKLAAVASKLHAEVEAARCVHTRMGTYRGTAGGLNTHCTH